MTLRISLGWAAAATGCAVAVFLVCLIWIAVIDPHDWAVLQPFYGMIFVAQPLALLGMVLAILVLRSQRDAKVAALAIVDLAILVLPWLWLAVVT